MESSRIRDGIRAGLPLALAPLLFSASFGLLAIDAGMGRLGAVVMSATTFAGSAQFAAASILDNGRRCAGRDRRRGPPQRPLRAAQPGCRVDLPRLAAAAASSSRS